MKNRLFFGWWIYSLVWCCLNVFWIFDDFKTDDWFALCIDGLFAVLFFFIAHRSWESDYYE